MCHAKIVQNTFLKNEWSLVIFRIRFCNIDHCGGLGVENGDSDMHVAVYKRSEK